MTTAAKKTKHVTVADVRKMVSSIKSAKSSYMVSILKDDLWMTVLKAIAAGHPRPRTLAREAFKGRRIKFVRSRS